MFGHLELFTEEMQKAYLEWCLTDDGKQYLQGGSKYKEDGKGECEWYICLGGYAVKSPTTNWEKELVGVLALSRESITTNV